MRPTFWTVILALVIISAAITVLALPTVPGQDEPMNGILLRQHPVDATHAPRQCLRLPGERAEILSPHGDTLVSARCQVIAHEKLDVPRWIVARYAWTLVFTAEDKARGANARDTATQEEVVLFETMRDHLLRPTWHARFDTGVYAVYRSISPEVAEMADGATLLSVQSCVNGTGGCAQDFLHRHADGRWSPVTETWRKELPVGFAGRIRHGVRIEPRTLHGEAGFYADADPNCCPSEVLEVDLVLRNDALALRGPARVRKEAP